VTPSRERRREYRTVKLIVSIILISIYFNLEIQTDRSYISHI